MCVSDRRVTGRIPGGPRAPDDKSRETDVAKGVRKSVSGHRRLLIGDEIEIDGRRLRLIGYLSLGGDLENMGVTPAGVFLQMIEAEGLCLPAFHTLVGLAAEDGQFRLAVDGESGEPTLGLIHATIQDAVLDFEHGKLRHAMGISDEEATAEWEAAPLRAPYSYRRPDQAFENGKPDLVQPFDLEEMKRRRRPLQENT